MENAKEYQWSLKGSSKVFSYNGTHSVSNPLCPFLSYSFFKPMLQNIKCKKKFNN